MMAYSLKETREILAGLGHLPKRFLGQNFLVDGNIVRKSVELGGVKEGDCVVEVGPGLGTLTGALLGAGAELWAVERDAGLAEFLRGKFGKEFAGRFHLLEADAVEVPLAGVPEEMGDRFKIVANLPYAISTPWMDAVLSSGRLPERMVLMLQLEAAERYAAVHGTKSFGAISIFLQSAYAVEQGHKVASSCFHPRPDVDSYLFNLARVESPVIFCEEVKRVIRGCFQQRRKQLGSVLRKNFSEVAEAWLEVLESEGLSGKSRAEEVPVEVWQKMAKA